MKALNIQRCLLYVSAFLYALAMNADTHNMTFSLSDFDIERNDSVVTITPNTIDYMFNDDTSKPAIPFMIYKEQINGTYIDGSFDVQIEEMTLIMSDVYIAPNRPSFSDSIINSTGSTLYTDSIYPASTPMVYRFSSYAGDDFNNIFFSVSPFVYDAKNRTLYFISSLQYSYSVEPFMESTGGENTSELDYLIVTSAALKDAFTPLKNWKTKKGVRTEVITVEEIYNNYAEFVTAQERIKNCIYDYYLDKGIKWVLLGGDVDIVPAQSCYIRYGFESSTVPSDLYYAAFDGKFNWNADGDSRYGEAEDGMSLCSSVLLSRLPVNNSAQVTSYVNKLLQYEKSPSVDGWLDKMLMMGCELFSSEDKAPYRSDAHYKGEIVFSNYIQPYAPNIIERHLYDTGNNLGYTGEMTNENVMNAINEEQPHFLFMQTHGDISAWQTSDGAFTNSDAIELENTNKPMVVVTTACHTNNFASNSLSESFIKNEFGGAIAYWGSSNFGWVSNEYDGPWPSLDMCAYFWKELFTGNNHFTSVVRRTKEYFIPADLDYWTTELWLQLSMNAIGDAEVPIYTQTPSIIDDAEIHVYPVSVSVTTDSTAYIAITSTSDNGNSIYQTANATSYSYNNGFTPVSVCLTRKNHVPLLIEGGGIYESMGYACLYLRNATFPSSSTTYHSENAYIGSSSGGNVVVENSGELVIDSDIKTVVFGGLHCKKGGKLVIK